MQVTLGKRQRQESLAGHRNGLQPIPFDRLNCKAVSNERVAAERF
jgi:hypothetical protein